MLVGWFTGGGIAVTLHDFFPSPEALDVSLKPKQRCSKCGCLPPDSDSYYVFRTT